MSQCKYIRVSLENIGESGFAQLWGYVNIKCHKIHKIRLNCFHVFISMYTPTISWIYTFLITNEVVHLFICPFTICIFPSCGNVSDLLLIFYCVVFFLLICNISLYNLNIGLLLILHLASLIQTLACLFVFFWYTDLIITVGKFISLSFHY